jgi:DNA-binding XRE family transcriptional regulator
MNLEAQIIEKDGSPEWVVVPYATYLRLVEEAEMLQDIRDYDAAKTAIARDEEELIPAQVVDALLANEQPVKVWREYRQMTRQQLAQAADISAPYLSQIESGRRTGSTEVLTALADALNITLDELAVRKASEE